MFADRPALGYTTFVGFNTILACFSTEVGKNCKHPSGNFKSNFTTKILQSKRKGWHSAPNTITLTQSILPPCVYGFPGGSLVLDCQLLPWWYGYPWQTRYTFPFSPLPWPQPWPQIGPKTGQKWARNAAAPPLEIYLLFRSADHHIALGQWESVKTTLEDPGDHIVIVLGLLSYVPFYFSEYLPSTYLVPLFGSATTINTVVYDTYPFYVL